MHPQNYFRPAYEFYNSVTLFSTSTILAHAPWMLPSAIAYPAAGIGYCCALLELYKGNKVRKFHKNLRSPRAYSISSDQIPRTNKALWLGTGFTWKKLHTQMLHDTQNKIDAFELPLVVDWARNNERIAEFTQQLSLFQSGIHPLRKAIAKVTSSNSKFNPVRPHMDLGGLAAIHGIEVNEKDIYQEVDERNGHTLVLGTTRVGKTRTAEVLIAQDIARRDIKNPEEFEAAVVVFDPKGDGDLFARAHIEAKRQGRKFYVFHLGFPSISARYNGVADFNRVSECATRVAGQLNTSGDGAAFAEFVWRFINIISNALFSMNRGVNFVSLNEYIQDMEKLFIELAKHVLTTLENKVPTLSNWRSEIQLMVNDHKPPQHDKALAALRPEGYALYQYLQEHSEIQQQTHIRTLLKNLNNLKHCVTHYDSTYFSKITASLLPLLEKLTSGKVAELIAPDYNDLQDNRPIISWSQILREKAVVYVGLDAMQDTAVASAVGNTMFADLLSTAGEIYKFGDSHGLPLADADKKTSVYIHADEFNELCGDEFLPLVNKAGGAGVKMTCYTQSRFDLDAKVGKDKSEVILANFNTLIMMRVKTPSTAEYLTDQLGEVNIIERTAVSGATTISSTEFTAKNEDRVTVKPVPLITTSTIINLPKGQAFVLHNGSRLDKVRFPYIDDRNCKFAALKQSKLVKEMNERYRKSSDSGEWWKQVDFDWTAGYKGKDDIALENVVH